MITGYRSSDSSVFSATDIFHPLRHTVAYEMLELGNKDICYTLKDKYNIKLDLRRKQRTLMEEVCKYIEGYFGTKDLVCIWLCTRAAYAAYLYGADVCKVCIPDNALLISDLGADGCLYVFLEQDISKTKVNRLITKRGIYGH